MFIRAILSVSILLVAATPAYPMRVAGTFTPTTKLGCALRQSSASISDIVILNRNATAIPAQTYVEVVSDSGGKVTVVAPNGIQSGGHLNIRHAKISGETCTATIVLVNAP